MEPQAPVGVIPFASSERPSVAFVLHALDLGGMQISLLRLAIGLAESGHKVWIVVHARGGQLESQMVPGIELVDLGVRRTLSSFVPLMDFIRERKPQYVISGQLHINVMIVAAARLMGNAFRTIVTEHAPPLPLITANAGWRYRMLPTLIRRLYPEADSIVAVSEGVRNELRSMLPPGTRVDVVHNPVTPPDLDRLLAVPNEDPWFTPEAPPLVLGVGRLATEKRFDLLIRAFASATKQARMNLMILGEGSERGRLEALAASLGLADRVRLVGFRDNPFSYMKHARVLVVTSDFEGFGNVLVEALSTGTPVISSDCPFGPREILQDGEYGRLLPMGDEQAFATALLESLEAPVDREKLKNRALHFSVERSVRGYSALMRECLGAPAGARGRSTRRRAEARPDFRGEIVVSKGEMQNGGAPLSSRSGQNPVTAYGSAPLPGTEALELDTPLPEATPADGTRPLKVAFYMHDLSVGGVERMLLGLLPELGKAGIDVRLLLHTKSGDLIESIPKGLPVIGFETRRTLFDIMPLRRYMRTHRPDVLVVSLNHNNIVGLIAKALAFSNTRVVICQHNALTSEAAEMGTWKYRIVPMLYRLLSPIADGIVAVSQGVAGDLAQATGIPEARITVINNPAITSDFEERAGIDVEHPWLGDPSIPVFVTAGRLVPQKDHETLLRALAIYRRKAPARLLVLGNGPLEGALRALACELGIEDAVDFLGFCNNPLPYMYRASAFVLSSRYEGFGNVIVEALGCGTPVVSTDCPYGPSEILGDGRWGLLTPVGNAEAMAAALSGDLRKQFPSAILRERARQFTASTAVKRYMELFDAL